MCNAFQAQNVSFGHCISCPSHHQLKFLISVTDIFNNRLKLRSNFKILGRMSDMKMTSEGYSSKFIGEIN